MENFNKNNFPSQKFIFLKISGNSQHQTVSTQNKLQHQNVSNGNKRVQVYPEQTSKPKCVYPEQSLPIKPS